MNPHPTLGVGVGELESGEERLDGDREIVVEHKTLDALDSTGGPLGRGEGAGLGGGQWRRGSATGVMMRNGQPEVLDLGIGVARSRGDGGGRGRRKGQRVGAQDPSVLVLQTTQLRTGSTHLHGDVDW